MEDVNQKDKSRLTESLTKLVAFADNPDDKQAWVEARIAIAQLGNIAGRLLANKPQEDIALTSSLSELDGFGEALRVSPKVDEVRRFFDVSLGDVEYRLKRLFGVAVR